MVQSRFLIVKKFWFFGTVLTYALLWLIVGTWKSSRNSDQSQPRNFSTADLFFIVDRLSKFSIYLILIDPNALKTIFINHSTLNKFPSSLITFAINEESVPLLEKFLTEGSLSIDISRSHTSIDHIFIENNHLIVHLVVLHRFNSYFLIPTITSTRRKDLKLSFGDVTRLIEISTLNDWKENVTFSYPKNVEEFLWLYETSRFIQCNRALANEMENRYHLFQNGTVNKVAFEPMKEIVAILNRLKKRHWLAGGTLLGWYRHCGFIPYTNDVDFGLFAEEYDETIRKEFLGRQNIYLWAALGLVNDSLEFRLFTGRFTFDLFWAYRDGDHRWCGFQIQRKKYRRLLPLLNELCSTTLFGSRFAVPCSPIEYLNNEYGLDRWKNPSEKNYRWTNIYYHSLWTDLSWMYAVRLYTPEGNLRTDQFAIDWIGKSFDYVFQTIPSFLNVLPNRTITLPPRKNLIS